MADYAKLQRQNPQIKPCVVSIKREPYIEAMLSASNLPTRRSQRLAKKQMAEKSKPETKKVPVQQSKLVNPPSSNGLAVAPKSILVDVRNSRLRTRSKSVSFDPQVSSPRASAVVHVKIGTMRERSKSVSYDAHDLLLNTASGHTTSDFAPVRRASVDAVEAKKSSFDVNEIKTTSKVGVQRVNTADVTSVRILDYQNRIESLVASNQAKISRIQQLRAERENLLQQVNDLHRLNLILAKGLDDVRADASNEPTGKQLKIWMTIITIIHII